MYVMVLPSACEAVNATVLFTVTPLGTREIPPVQPVNCAGVGYAPVELVSSLA